MPESIMASPSIAIVVAIATSITYVVSVCSHRLFFHPLRSVPGPKLAAMTGWYETYFELLHKGLGGQFTFHIRELHSKYGPIVRISPWEVHIDDPNFFSVLYTNKQGFDKADYLRWRFGAPYAMSSTSDHRLHRMRRASQEPFFAQTKIEQFSPRIWDKADRVCARLAAEYAGRPNKPVVLDKVFASYAADVATLYSFNRDFGFIERPDFDSSFLEAVQNLKILAHPCAQFPWLGRLLYAIPEWVIRILQPSVACVLDFQEDMRKLIRAARRDLGLDFGDAEEKDQKLEDADPEIAQQDQRRTVIHGILQSGLPENELGIENLKDAAINLIGGAVASTQWTLSIAFFHILSNRQIYTTLKEELAQTSLGLAAPDDRILLCQIPDRFPYLMACIEEALRVGCPQTIRSPRIHKTKPIVYGKHVLPPGTHMSMDAWHMHHNEIIFPDSFSFRPERWLPEGGPSTSVEPAAGANGSKLHHMMVPERRPLKHYMVAFGKGTRRCIAETLARAKVAILLVALLTSFEWELYETTEEDMRIVRDLVAPDVSSTSKGVRVLIKCQRV
ncbi:Cytochrome P450 [Naviculisporaceae sp. PSN 640]